jgi:hypothetical protein
MYSLDIVCVSNNSPTITTVSIGKMQHRQSLGVQSDDSQSEEIVHQSINDGPEKEFHIRGCTLSA